MSPYLNILCARLEKLYYTENTKSSHINPAFRHLHWLKVKQHIRYKILPLTFKVLTTTQPLYLYNLISVQPHRNTHSSDIITLSRPPSSSSLKVNNRSFHHASPCLWNQLPKEPRLPTDCEDSRSHLISHMSVRHFLHHHCHHPLLLLTSTPDSKLIFSTNLLLPNYSAFAPTGLISRIPAVFVFVGHVGFNFSIVC